MMLWDPFEDMADLRNAVDQIFDGFSSGRGWMNLRRFPTVELTEEDDRFVLIADMPGVNKDNINLSLTGNLLSISGQREMRKPTDDASPVRTERRSGEFKRTIELPSSVEGDDIKATLRDGVLKLILLKKEESKVRSISIGS
jgi:HSP20 family protein